MGMLEVCERADNMPISATPIIGDEPRPCPVVEENQIAVRMESSFVVGWFQHVLPRLKKEILLSNTAHKGPLPAVCENRPIWYYFKRTAGHYHPDES